MKKVLHIISSPRGASSFSVKLGNAIVEKIREAYPGSTVKETNVVTKHFPHLEQSLLTAFFTSPGDRSPEQEAAVKLSDEAIKDIFEADIVVIGAPLYNFGIHSSLKAWIDHIIRAGITFRYDEYGVYGLVKDKKVYIAMSGGGIYSEGPLVSYDFVVPYLEKTLGFIGLTDVTVFRVEGTNTPGMDQAALEKGINRILID